MIPNDRKEEILELMEKHQYMTVPELAQRVHVSEPTIRRDFIQLEKDGLIKRSRGGASFLSKASMDWPFVYRNKLHREEKRYIAQLATAYISNDDTIFMDSSSTCYCLAEILDGFANLRVLTHSIPILQMLSEKNGVTPDCVCGTYRRKRAAIYGYEACSHIAKHHAKIFFLSCTGLHPEYGLSDRSEEDMAIKQAFYNNSDQTVLLIDSSKIRNDVCYYKVMDIKNLTAIISDRPLPKEIMDYCRESGVEVSF